MLCTSSRELTRTDLYLFRDMRGISADLDPSIITIIALAS